MKFIIGGAYQGKKDFALKYFKNYNIINNYHLTIKNLISKDINPIEFTEKLLTENNNIVIIMNEIGCGIVPIDKNERFWREMCGKCGCIIAEKSETVVRVVCGTGIVIKGKL